MDTRRGVPKEKSRSGVNVFELTEKCFAALTEFKNVEMIDTEDTDQTKLWSSSLGRGNEGNVRPQLQNQEIVK